MNRSKRFANSHRRGVILIIVVVAILLISLAIFGFAASMRTEYKAARANENQMKSQAAAKSGIELIKSLMTHSAKTREQMLGDLDLALTVLSRDSNERPISGFSIAVPKVVSGRERLWRMLLETESSKINLPALLRWEKDHPGHARIALRQLPNMSDEIADAILDWIDEDSLPRQMGAESTFYSQQTPAYQPRNGVPKILDELMLVRGVTREHLFGNQFAFAGEPPVKEEFTFEDSKTIEGAPWVRYLTLRSAERNETFDGRPRINLNDEDLNKLHQELVTSLGVEWADFVIAYRQFGKSKESDSTKFTSTIELDFSKPAKFEIESPFDLIDAKVRLESDKKKGLVSPITTESPTGIQEFLDAVTNRVEKVIHGRINLMHAPREVLLAIPEIDAGAVDRIIAARDSVDETPRHAVWLVENRSMSLESMKKIEPYVTCRGEVVRATSIGFVAVPKTFSHLQFVIDATGDQPQQIYCKDIQDLGLAKSIFNFDWQNREN